MSEGLAAFLSEQRADAATLQQAVRYLVSEWGDDLPPAQMRAQLDDAAGAEQVDAVLGELTADGELMERLTLAVLEAAWEDDGLREAARGAIEDAKKTLPIIEAAVVAIAAMYGMFLVATRGRKRHARSVVRRPDGTYEERELTEWYGASGPLAVVAKLFVPVGKHGSEELPEAPAQELPPPDDADG